MTIYDEEKPFVVVFPEQYGYTRQIFKFSRDEMFELLRAVDSTANGWCHPAFQEMKQKAMKALGAIDSRMPEAY